MIPDNVRAWLDGWGSRLQRAIETGVTATHRQFGLQRRKLPQRLLVGTDCSGIDAPIHGLRELCIPHQHLFGSEVAAGPRSVIEANTKPSQALFQSVLDGDTAPFVHLYVAGFSCKPFSLLHHETKLLEEDQAKIFYAVVARIEQVRPACFVLENVTGIKRVSAEVLRVLRSVGYQVEMLLMNPAELGEPIQRPRYYFIAVRQDVSLISPQKLLSWLSAAWASVKEAAAPGSAAPLLERLLPASHHAVARYQAARKRQWLKASEAGFPGSQAAKWQEVHKQSRDSLQACKPAAESSSPCTADALFLHLPRQRDAWDLLCRQHDGSHALAADLSQSLTRCGVRTDGSLPTITPGGILAAAEAKRVIAPLEKILLHAFPIHRMIFPSSLRDAELASMGGNTMHVQIVGIAMMFAVSLVDWTKPVASTSVASAALGRGRGQRLRQRLSQAARAPRLRLAGSPAADPVATALAMRWQSRVRPCAGRQKRSPRKTTKQRCRKRASPAQLLVSRLAARWASGPAAGRVKGRNS